MYKNSKEDIFFVFSGISIRSRKIW